MILGNGGIIALNVQINGGGLQFKAQNVNGRRVIDVTDGDKKIHIENDPQKGIEVVVTEKVDGKEKVNKTTAKNEEDLKKNHPEADKIYQKYSQMGGAQNFRIQGFAGGIGGPLPNGAIPAIPGVPGLQVPGQPQAGPNGAVPGAAAPAAPAVPPSPANPQGQVAPQLAPQRPGDPVRQSVDEIVAARKQVAELREQFAKKGAENADPELAKTLSQLESVDKQLGDALDKLKLLKPAPLTVKPAPAMRRR